MNTVASKSLLKLDPSLDRLGDKDKNLRDGLSAVVLVENTLWVAGDETTRLERLIRAGNGDGKEVYDRHEAFALSTYLDLPAKDKEEADIEGMDVSDGYLWLVGSHSLKRGQPKKKAGESADAYRKSLLAKPKTDGNRFLLARIPLLRHDDTFKLAKETDVGGSKRVAARLRGDAEGSDLTAALASDKHLGPFLSIPGKDNGLDIEGLCVAGERVFVGLRGPVLRGWATVLELAVRPDPGSPSVFGLQEIGPGGQRYRKHFLDLGGLGVRDLCVDGADLLILAGPTMDLDGPVAIFRWPNGARPGEESVVFADGIFADGIKKLADVPFGADADHAEGMTLHRAEGGQDLSVLLLYDAPSKERKESPDGETNVQADIFRLDR